MTTNRWNADLRLLGAFHLAPASNAGFVSCRHSRRLLYATWASASGYTIAADSGDIGSQPGRIVYAGTFGPIAGRVTTVCEDGSVRSYTAAPTTLVLGWSTPLLAIGARAPAWCDAVGTTIVVAPLGACGAVTLNAATGAVLARVEGICSPLAFAFYRAGYLYCFDDDAHCVIVSINTSTGAMAMVGSVTLANCRGVIDARLASTPVDKFFVVSASRPGIATISLADPMVPVEIAWTPCAGLHVNDVGGGISDGPKAITDEDATSLYPFVSAGSITPAPWWWPALDYEVMGANTFAAGRNARLLGAL